MKILNKIEVGICILCLIAMTTLVFANVFSRYVLHLSLSFSEEITTNLFVLLSMTRPPTSGATDGSMSTLRTTSTRPGAAT